MKHLLKIIIITIMLKLLTNLTFASDFKFKSRQRRLVIFPQGSTFVQLVLGVGLPFQVDKRSVTVGPFLKSYYQLPTNSSYYTNPSITDITGERRRKRETFSRWNIYATLSATANFLGYGGKACILRAICEAAEMPFSQHDNIWNELLHVILTPSSTAESTYNNFDNEYHAAENVGKTVKNCKRIYPECSFNFMNMFTQLFVY